MPNLVAPQLPLSSGPELITAVPHLLGYHPGPGALVALAVDDRGWCAIHYALPSDRWRAEVAQRLAQRILSYENRIVHLAGYGPDHEVSPCLDTVISALRVNGICVERAVRVRHGSWIQHWPHRYDAVDEPLPTPQTVAVDGRYIHPSRHDAAKALDPVTGPAREAMDTATARAEAQLKDLPEAELISTFLPVIGQLMDRPRPLSDQETAELGIALTVTRLRDEALRRTDGDDPERHILMWRTVVRRVDRAYLAAPASLLAYTAYLHGDGVLANFALERAQQADPGSTLADLLRQMIEMAVPREKARHLLTH